MQENMQLVWYNFISLFKRNSQRYLNSLIRFLYGGYIRTTIPLVSFFLIVLLLIHPETTNHFNPLIDYLKKGSEEDVHNYIIFRNLGLFVVGLLGSSLAAWRAKSLARQAYIAEQEHMANRKKGATEQLGSTDIMIRVSGIYSLASVAKDSKDEEEIRNIMDILCIFIRENCKKEHNLYSPKEDVQTAINQLTHLAAFFGLIPFYKINLPYTNLQNYNFENTHLIQANFKGANLKSANFSNASLEGACLEGANIEGVSFTTNTFNMVKLTSEQCEILGITNHKWM